MKSKSSLVFKILIPILIVAGTSMGFVKNINENEKYKKLSSALKILMGVAILLIGLYMFWLAF
ncbi:hypothetical protein [Butyrivibrio sp. INlla16]|uniref:hypothetical protein n=1 Tax=Butyrivibrio sp. INlla16 TaxID=1520807 RepID=UPI000B85F97D|nr:hypothetical protein [Butyrivibrio sp. INlla16]